MKNVLKIVFCIVVIVVFWTSLIGIHVNVTNVFGGVFGGEIENRDQVEIPIMEYNVSNKGILQAERLIVLRMDDVQAYSWRDATINLTDTVLTNNISIALSVIPEEIGTDPILRNYLIEKSRDNRIEIAQHGFKHDRNEFLNLSKDDAYRSIKSGTDIIRNSLRVKPVTFIPPYNVYNENTTIALSELNFSIISGGRDEYGKINNVTRFGFNTETKKSAGYELIPEDVVLTECNRSLQERNICVIMMHVQDYVNKDGKMNATKYVEFVKMLEGMKSLNAKYVTFKDLVAYEFPEQIASPKTI